RPAPGRSAGGAHADRRSLEPACPSTLRPETRAASCVRSRRNSFAGAGTDRRKRWPNERCVARVADDDPFLLCSSDVCDSDYPTYQTLHCVCRTIAVSALHENAFWNSGMFETTPFTRYFSGECGLVCAIMRIASGRRVAHQI